ncbi:MAG TPA: hypothetical protein VFW50_06960 [Streptosporangiaceae bacterium]|nr:hypothetical protein [Streptosporangiaceae bacterium]
MLITAFGARRISPSVIQAHDRAEPDDEPSGQQVPPDVADQRAEDRCWPPDGRGPEPVEYPGGEVRVEGDAAVDGDEHDGERERAGQQELQVTMRRAGQRTAEQVGEQQREQHRDAGDVAQLFRYVPDLEQGPPREREGGCRRAGRGRALGP